MKISRLVITIVVVLCTTVPFILFGNNDSETISELKKELYTASEKEKAVILIDISNHFRYSNYDSTLKYALSAESYAIRFDLISERIEALLLIARSSSNIGKADYAVSIYNKAKEIALKSANATIISKVYLDYSVYYTSKFNYTKVLSTLDSALYYITNYNVSELKPRVYYRIANLYYTLNNIQVAKKYVQLSRYALDNYNNNEIRVKIDHLEGMIYFKENNPVKSLDLLQKALDISKQIDDRRMEQVSYRRLSVYYIDTKDYETAKIYIDSSLVICDELGLNIERSALTTFLAHLAWLENDYITALEYNLKAYDIRESTGHRIAISSSLLNIGGNYIKLKDFTKAEYYIAKGLNIAKEQGALIYIARGYNLLSQVYERTGRYEMALDYFRTRTLYQDSVFNIKSTEKTLFFSSLYEEERIRREEEAEKLDKISTNNIYLFIMVILLAAIILLLFWMNFVKKKQHKEILKLSKVIETTDQGVLISDANGNIDYFNNGAVKLLKYSSKAEFEGKKITDIVDQRGTILFTQTVIPQLIKEGSWSGETDFSTKDGEKRVGYLTCSTIANGNKPDLLVAIFSDISDRKKNEQALRESQRELRETVETQEKMFSIIAHDLTGPFNTILGFTNELASNFDSYDKKDLVKFSHIINESSKNTYNLLNNLLHWSRTKLGRMKINKIQVDLYPILEQNINLLTPTAAGKEIQIINNVDENADVLADGATLDIVLRNLISNSIKFTPKQGTVTINFEESDNEYKISVSDTGIGIKPNDIKNLFIESKAKSTPGTENEKGTGLGLIVCNELITSNNGVISVVSTIEKGTTFTIRLPKN